MSMDLHYYNNNNNNYEHGRNDQIVSQFVLKALHIVLDSRVPSIRRHGEGNLLLLLLPLKKTDKWFNLALGNRPPALDSLNLSCHRNLISDPMVLDIILVQETQTQNQPQSDSETVIERWVVQYEESSSASTESHYKKTYKRSIILLRSLHTMMRLLPAYRAYRKLSTKGNACGFDIIYKLSSSLTAPPLSRSEEQLMKLYTFFPVEAQHGRLSISLKYRQSLSLFNLETSSSFPPEIITDYVGSPATDPFRAFANTKPAITFPVREIPPPSQRPHSWTSGAPFQSPHSSSGRRYDLSSSPAVSSYAQRTHSCRPLTPHSFDDSPPFSPSPPTYLSGGGNYLQSPLRSETAPLSIPNPLLTTTPTHISPNLSDPSRHSLPPLSPRGTPYELSSHESSKAIRSLKKSDMSRVGDLASASANANANANHYSSAHKVSRDNKDDSGRFSGLLSSSGSPRIGFSRSSSRLSLQDDLDDIDFSCPFIVDDVDTCHSPVSQSGKKSQDAAVGALVRMLRTAPPLRQDSSCCSDHVEAQSNTSGLCISRKTSDALEELKAYTGIKHFILSKSKDTKQQHVFTL